MPCSNVHSTSIHRAPNQEVSGLILTVSPLILHHVCTDMVAKHKDITGQKFGILTVVGMVKKGTLFHAVCECACGGTKTVAPTNLYRGMQSCGCLPRARKPTLLSHMIGQRFGFLEVLTMEQVGKTESGKQSGTYYAVCCCHNCGNPHHPVLPAALRRGATTSCGCREDHYVRNSGENNVGYKGYREISGKFWNGYKKGAAERGIQFDLSIKTAWALFERQGRCCALSGTHLVFGPGRNSRTTASLDRINNTRGYVSGNVQWVHKRINLMRNTLEIDDFVEWCGRVANRHGWTLENSRPLVEAPLYLPRATSPTTAR